MSKPAATSPTPAPARWVDPAATDTAPPEPHPLLVLCTRLKLFDSRLKVLDLPQGILWGLMLVSIFMSKNLISSQWHSHAALMHFDSRDVLCIPFLAAFSSYILAHALTYKTLHFLRSSRIIEEVLLTGMSVGQIVQGVQVAGLLRARQFNRGLAYGTMMGLTLIGLLSLNMPIVLLSVALYSGFLSWRAGYVARKLISPTENPIRARGFLRVGMLFTRSSFEAFLAFMIAPLIVFGVGLALTVNWAMFAILFIPLAMLSAQHSIANRSGLSEEEDAFAVALRRELGLPPFERPKGEGRGR